MYVAAKASKPVWTGTALCFLRPLASAGEELFDADINHLRATFLDNGYPKELIDVCLKGTFADRFNEYGNDNERLVTDAEDEEHLKLLVFPSLREIEKQLKTLFKKVGY